MPLFTTVQSRTDVQLCTPELELSFSLDDGGLVSLNLPGRPNVLGHGVRRPSIDIQAGVDGAWLAERVFVRYLRHMVDERDGAVELTIVIGIGPLMVYDRLRITGTLIARRVSVQNVSEDEISLRAVRMALPWARVGDLETCRFEAPGNSVRPHVPMIVAAQQRRGVLPRRFFAPGLRENRALEPTPSIGPGLMALHDAHVNEALVCWYHSDVEPALPQIEGNDVAVTLLHEVELADRLRSDVGLSGGTQYVLLVRQHWQDALQSVLKTQALMGIDPHHTPVAWAANATMYETHPAEFGGFAGLEAALPGIQALGVNTLCVLPIWSFANRTGRLWDGSWEQTGDLYAVRDFEQLDTTLGDADAMRAMVDAAHSLGLRVLLDLPMIGAAEDSPYVQARPEWFCSDEQGTLLVPPTAPHLRPFDWSNDNLVGYVLNQAEAYVLRFDLDGYRVALPRTPRPNWQVPPHLHASSGMLGPFRLMHELRLRLARHKHDVALFSRFAGPLCVAAADILGDELPHHMFIHAGMQRIPPQELGEWLRDYAALLPHEAVRVCFTESYNTRILNPLADGLRGSRISQMLLAGLVFCGFVPMIRTGQEQGDAVVISQLFNARNRYAVLRTGEIYYNRVQSDSPSLFVVLRIGPEGALLGLLNFGSHKRRVRLRLPLDLMDLHDDLYGLTDVLHDSRRIEDGCHSWKRSDLNELVITVEPFSATGLLLHPVEPETPEDGCDADEAEVNPPIEVVGSVEAE